MVIGLVTSRIAINNKCPKAAALIATENALAEKLNTMKQWIALLEAKAQEGNSSSKSASLHMMLGARIAEVRRLNEIADRRLSTDSRVGPEAGQRNDAVVGFGSHESPRDEGEEIGGSLLLKGVMKLFRNVGKQLGNIWSDESEQSIGSAAVATQNAGSSALLVCEALGRKTDENNLFVGDPKCYRAWDSTMHPNLRPKCSESMNCCAHRDRAEFVEYSESWSRKICARLQQLQESSSVGLSDCVNCNLVGYLSRVLREETARSDKLCGHWNQNPRLSKNWQVWYAKHGATIESIACRM